MNLEVNKGLWTLLAQEKPDLPSGIRVALSNFNGLGLRAGEPIQARARCVHVGSRLVVDCRAALRWSPRPPRPARPGLAHRLALVAAAARERSWAGSARMADAIKSALDDPAVLEAVLAEVVGSGPGATPAGDDVLVGILAVLRSPHSGNAGAEMADRLSQFLFPLLPGTTDISGHLLRHATAGLFGRDIHELVATLFEGASSGQMENVARRVVESGATSGADTCEGVLALASSYSTAPDEMADA